MKKLLLILLPLALLSCSNDDEQGCTCFGEFTRANNPEESFFAPNVDCDTGQPILDLQNEGQIGIDNPAFYKGCSE